MSHRHNIYEHDYQESRKSRTSFAKQSFLALLNRLISNIGTHNFAFYLRLKRKATYKTPDFYDSPFDFLKRFHIVRIGQESNIP